MTNAIKRVDIAGVQIHHLTMRTVLGMLFERVLEGSPCFVVTPNVDHIVQLQSDNLMQAAYRSAAFVVCDGVPLIWASRVLGAPLPERINGTDLFEALCEQASKNGHRVFLLGGRPGAADLAAAVLTEKFPGLIVAGTACPDFGFEHDEFINNRLIETVREAKADYLFVGLGAPKQEVWLHQHHVACGVPVSVGVGVSFEFVGGVVPRAPLWMQKIGLEWLHRLYSEPRRLWRRYLFRDPKFAFLVAKQLLRKS